MRQNWRDQLYHVASHYSNTVHLHSCFLTTPYIMTTIAANRRYMAADTFVGMTDTPYSTVKIERVGDSLVGCAGPSPWCRRFLNWRSTGGRKPRLGWSEPFRALVLNKIGLYVFENDCEPDRVVLGFHAIGTGGMAALAVLHMGHTPAEAVSVACKLDMYSKLPVTVLRL